MDKSLKGKSLLIGSVSHTPRSSFAGKSMVQNRSLNESRQNTRTSVQVVLKGLSNTVERFGLPIPVQVEEAFSFSDKNTVITAKVSESGYAWVVCGRKLLVWRYQNIKSNASPKKWSFPICHELRLPQSDLAHRAELVAVYLSKNAKHPSCVAVSPEGMVRYWLDITHDHRSVDQNVDLNGEECDSLIEAGILGCVFVTTSCTVVLVQHKPGSYEEQLNCRTLKTPASWLGGFSKRVTSIFFGPMSSDQGNENRIIRLLSVPGIQQICNIYVLAGLNFQKWILNDKEPEQLCWSSDLSRVVKDAFQQHLGHWDVNDSEEVDAWILDLQPDRERVIMLCAAVYLPMSPMIHYAMISIPTNGPTVPTVPNDFFLLKINNMYKENTPGDALNYRFILCGNNAYFYTAKSITVLKPEEELDVLEFLHPSDQIFSGCTCLNVPIFFSRQHGLVSVIASDADRCTLGASSLVLDTGSGTDQSCSAGGQNLSLYQLDPHEIYTAHQQTDGQLKAAFIFHVKNQLTECYDMVNKLFPTDAPIIPGFDGPLDTVVIKIAKDILDDIPAGDHRWNIEGHSTQGLGSSNSMLVFHQLKNKQRAFALYLKFLQESGLWNKLTGLTIRCGMTTTIQVLGELAEKNTAAIIMKSLPLGVVLEDSIKRAVKNYTKAEKSVLSEQDIFFREVTRIQEGILCCAEVCENACHSAMQPEAVARTLHEGNQIILTVLTETLQYRQQTAESFQLNDVAKSMNLEYLPWTAAGGPEGIVDALMLQQSLTLNYGLKVDVQRELTAVLLDEFVMLTDIILDGRKTHISTVKSAQEKPLYKQYCSDRNKLIKPLIAIKAYQKAAILAEKYLDFEVLMNICDENKDEDRLNEYMRRFKDTSFPEYVYNWYLREGKHARLLNRYRKIGDCLPEGREKLARFLSAYPTLSWMQQIYDRDFSSASETLRILAENETELVTRQKAMYSLSKLAKLAAPLASDTSDLIAEVNKRLELISYQEGIPDYVLQQHGFDCKNPKVFKPRELIALYISEEYVDSSEIDFQKALDVAAFVDDESERVEIVLQIWRAALLRDSWSFHNLDDPIECLQNTMFFRVVDLAIALNYNPSKLLPPIDMLLDDRVLDTLKRNVNFELLLKMGYEHFYRTQLL
ncbi:hypothetical protein HUJ04_012680 [Dendroctonus ponderosae]|uniref:Nucleoporin Nup133/Nup155-like N-terminal domain-containing protein n=1 Tax=Dendroctonus ponderosae TaxID=77166 RepID=A0AAR5PV76_DENPD|nr:hypothetical protein HUJ04_012680 [Dendroctonus ponderosae]KAH1023483.1 hypothetical protein HUJ04_012680 [Dendroctonus ponderosae]